MLVGLDLDQLSEVALATEVYVVIELEQADKVVLPAVSRLVIF